MRLQYEAHRVWSKHIWHVQPAIHFWRSIKAFFPIWVKLLWMAFDIFLFTVNDDWKVHLGNFWEWGKKIYTTVMSVSLTRSLSQKVVPLVFTYLYLNSRFNFEFKCFNVSTQLALFCGLLWSVKASLHCERVSAPGCYLALVTACTSWQPLQFLFSHLYPFSKHITTF